MSLAFLQTLWGLDNLAKDQASSPGQREGAEGWPCMGQTVEGGYQTAEWHVTEPLNENKLEKSHGKMDFRF